jgi:hypothetical protein
VAGCCECGDEPSGSCATELLRVVTVCTTYFTFQQLYILPTERIYWFRWILIMYNNHYFNNINKLIFVLDTRCVFFAVGFLSII